MNVKSKSWNWDVVTIESPWKIPARESYWLINHWQNQGKKDFLDLGVGLGRHAIQFAKAGFNTSGFDLSETSIKKTKEWAKAEKLNINTKKRIEEGPENGIPHFYADIDLIFDIFQNFEIIAIEEKQEFFRQSEYTHKNKYGMVQSGWHYYILGRKK